MPYSNWHRLEHSVYMDTKRLIKKYPDYIAEYDSIVGASPIHDGQPRGSGISDPTGNTVARFMDISFKIDAIHKSLDKVPYMYRSGVFGHIVYGKPFPYLMSVYTWRTWQYRFVYYVREYLDERGL